jgi:hypothetical protein
MDGMSDEDALLEAVGLLTAIANIAGGYASRQQRERIAALETHVRPRVIERNGKLFGRVGHG